MHSDGGPYTTATYHTLLQYVHSIQLSHAAQAGQCQTTRLLSSAAVANSDTALQGPTQRLMLQRQENGINGKN